MEKSETARSRRANHIEGNVLKGCVEQFGDRLVQLGYAARTVRVNLDSARHFAEWLRISGVAPSDIDERVIGQFAGHQCVWSYEQQHGDLSPRYIDRVRRFVRFVQQSEVTRAPARRPALIADARVAEFQDWLRVHRGLAERTVTGQGCIITRFLSELGHDPTAYNAAVIRELIVGEASTPRH